MRGRAAIAPLLLVLGCEAASLPSPETASAPVSSEVLVLPSAAEDAATHEEVLALESKTQCERVAIPALSGPIVVTGEHMTTALAPVVRALCACTAERREVRVVATIEPTRGHVHAEAIGAPDVDECLQRSLDGLFPPFEVGACVTCGVARYDQFHAPSPPPTPKVELRYPLTFIHASVDQSP